MGCARLVFSRWMYNVWNRASIVSSCKGSLRTRHSGLVYKLKKSFTSRRTSQWMSFLERDLVSLEKASCSMTHATFGRP